MAYIIREAEERDCLALSGLMSQLSGREVTGADMANRLEFVARSPFDSLYVYEQNSRVRAALGFRIRENLEEVSRYGEISVIVVDEEERGRGIGRILMNYAEQLAIRHECKGSWLVSGVKRDKAHSFYKESGYEVNGYRFVKHLTGPKFKKE
ncbi:GNAT family N-acetyltransferase [Paenibacillus sp. RC84]|uniref:GNAT family N-acetyltransferase n=1 Tax=Paenibacillus sp. RC84 TaxID=3156252 RepID=UPI0035146F94